MCKQNQNCKNTEKKIAIQKVLNKELSNQHGGLTNIYNFSVFM